MPLCVCLVFSSFQIFQLLCGSMWRLVCPGGPAGHYDLGTPIYGTGEQRLLGGCPCQAGPICIKASTLGTAFVTQPLSGPHSLQAASPAQEVVAESGTHQLHSPEDWWALIMGSGYRGTVEQLAATDREQLRETNLAYIREHGVNQLQANVVYAIARKE